MKLIMKRVNRKFENEKGLFDLGNIAIGQPFFKDSASEHYELRRETSQLGISLCAFYENGKLMAQVRSYFLQLYYVLKL